MKQSSTNQSACICIFIGTNIPTIDRTLSFNPLTPIIDQGRISPYSFDTISSRQVRRMKKKTQPGDYKMIQYQILQTNIVRIVRRITDEISGAKGLTTYRYRWPSLSSFSFCLLFLVLLSFLISTTPPSLTDGL